MTQSNVRLDLETIEKAAEIFPGFWVIATRHHPGGSKQWAEINNRCAIFRVDDTSGPVLFTVNQPDPVVIPEVKRIEKETGLEVRYLVSPGGGHHMRIDAWHAAFPNAQVYVGPERIPRTRHGQTLMKMPRVSTMNLQDPFPQFRGQLDFVLFHGLRGFREEISPMEGGKDTMWEAMKIMKQMILGLKDPADELWLFHPASGVVMAGENLTWMMPADRIASLPMMSRGMFRPGVAVNGMARKVGDPSTVAGCWKKVVAWPSKVVMTFHDPPGFAFVGDGRAELEKAARVAKQI